MKFEPRPPHAGATHRPKEGGHHHHNARQGTCVALVDAHYLQWLLKPAAEEEATDPLQRTMLPAVLGSALKQAHMALDIKRIYWYGDTNDHQYPNDQVARWFGADAADEVFHALSADIRRLAERQACDHLLVASDDVRLRAVMDEAQLYGLGVHLLADDTARHMDQIEQEDPDWCQLLAQADRRIFLHPMALKDLTQTRASYVAGTSTALEQSRPKLQEVVQAWWEEEPEDLREDLREELAGIQGIPQEVDRHLLLRVRRVLDRPLNFSEKKLLREIVRNKVLGLDPAPANPDSDSAPD